VPLDLSGLEKEGLRQCDEGLKIIKGCEELLIKTSLSPSESASLKAELEKGKGLITRGMEALSQANEKSNGKMTYDTKDYLSARKVAGMKLLELGGK
jgi:hypothetical protein